MRFLMYLIKNFFLSFSVVCVHVFLFLVVLECLYSSASWPVVQPSYKIKKEKKEKNAHMHKNNVY